MSSALPLIIFAVLIVALLYVSKRNRQRMATRQQQLKENLAPGAEIMTTSGLYGTVVEVNHQDDTVLLSVAPGVEVKWALAAVREAASTPQRYAGGASGVGDGSGAATQDGDSPGTPPKSYWDEHPRRSDEPPTA